MPYHTETREQFFSEDWETAKAIIDLAIRPIEPGSLSVLSPQQQEELINKQCAIIRMLKDMIVDCRADIAELRKERNRGLH